MSNRARFKLKLYAVSPSMGEAMSKAFGFEPNCVVSIETVVIAEDLLAKFKTEALEWISANTHHRVKFVDLNGVFFENTAEGMAFFLAMG